MELKRALIEADNYTRRSQFNIQLGFNENGVEVEVKGAGFSLRRTALWLDIERGRENVIIEVMRIMLDNMTFRRSASR